MPVDVDGYVTVYVHVHVNADVDVDAHEDVHVPFLCVCICVCQCTYPYSCLCKQLVGTLVLGFDLFVKQFSAVGNFTLEDPKENQPRGDNVLSFFCGFRSSRLYGTPAQTPKPQTSKLPTP